MNTHTFLSARARGGIFLSGVACIAGLVIDMVLGGQSTTINIINAVNTSLIVLCLSFYSLGRVAFKTMVGVLFYSIAINILVRQVIAPPAPQAGEFFLRDNLALIMFAPVIALVINRRHVFIVGLLIVVFYVGSLVVSHNRVIMGNIAMLALLNVAFISIMYFLVAQVEKCLAIQAGHRERLASRNEELRELLAATSIPGKERDECLEE